MSKFTKKKLAKKCFFSVILRFFLLFFSQNGRIRPGTFLQFTRIQGMFL